MGLDNPVHIAFLVVILLLLFGAKRLPEIGRQLGSGMREFKDSVTGSGSSQSSQQAALPQASQVAAQPAPPPAPPAAVTTPPAAPAPDQAQAAAPAPEPAAAEPTHQA